VARVWEMEPKISWAVRKNYLLKAKKFFKSHPHQAQKKKILELGCGSGWVGQFLAGKDLQIIGTDFSQKQIELAKGNARLKEVDQFTQYYVVDSQKIFPNYYGDGILIHSFLHHLDGQELEKLLSDIKEKFARGTKLFIYEPAFYRKKDKTFLDEKKDHWTAFLLQRAQRLHQRLENYYARKSVLKKEIKEVYKLQQMALKNNWYLSPKEVPFEVTAFTQDLQKYFLVQNHYWATVYLVCWTAKINMIKNPWVKRLIALFFIPFFAWVDRKIAQNGNYLKQNIIYPNYAFHIWECVIK
jgi:SAM-dependent methyltransferase